MTNWEKVANSIQEECESTNDLAKQLAAEGYPHGTWISAKKQTQGRGRSGNKWISEEGNLFLSVLLRHCPKELSNWIPLMTGIAICKILQTYSPNLRLKWPNDLFLGDQKAGGILCESSSSAIIVGIGLNCNSAPKFGTSLQQSSQKAPPLDCLRVEVLQGVLKEYLNLVSDGSSSIKAHYERLCYLTGDSEIQWNQGKNEGIVRGLGTQGELLVQTKNGLLSLYSEEVSQVRVKSNHN